MKRLLLLNALLLVNWLPYSVRCWVLLEEALATGGAPLFAVLNGGLAWLALANLFLLWGRWYRPLLPWVRGVLLVVLGALGLFGGGMAWFGGGAWTWDVGVVVLSGYGWSIAYRKIEADG